MVPELGVNVGFDLTRQLRLVGGYSLIYWSAVARTGDQIDLNLAAAQFPPQSTTASHFPEFRFAMNDYWCKAEPGAGFPLLRSSPYRPSH